MVSLFFNVNFSQATLTHIQGTHYSLTANASAGQSMVVLTDRPGREAYLLNEPSELMPFLQPTNKEKYSSKLNAILVWGPSVKLHPLSFVIMKAELKSNQIVFYLDRIMAKNNKNLSPHPYNLEKKSGPVSFFIDSDSQVASGWCPNPCP